MSLSKVDLRYRPLDLKLSVVLDDYRRAINNIVDSVNGLSTDNEDTSVVAADVMDSLNSDYFARSGRIYIKNYYSTTVPLFGGGTLSSGRTLSLLYFDTDLGIDADDKLYVKDSGIDHGGIGGLADDDHTQYLLANGTRGLSADWNAGAYDITCYTVQLTSLTDGYIPYHVNDTTGLANSNLFYDGGDFRIEAGGGNLLLNTAINSALGYLQIGSLNPKTENASIIHLRSNEVLASNPLELRISQAGNATASKQAFQFQVGHYGADFSANILLNPAGGNIGIANSDPIEKLDIGGRLALIETTAPSATASYGKIYVKSADSLLYFLTSGGVEYDLTATGGGGGGAPDDAEYIVGVANATLTNEIVKAWLADNYNLDDYPGSPDTLDDEFENSSIDGAWTIVNNPADPNTVSESKYPGHIWCGLTELGTDNFDNLIRMYKTAPTGTQTLEFIIKGSMGATGLSGEDAEFSSVGMYIGNPTDDELIGICIQFNNNWVTTMPYVVRGQYSASDGIVHDFTTYETYVHPVGTTMYAKWKKTTANAYTSANTYEAYLSVNGITWIQVGTYAFTFTTLPTECGVYWRRPKSQTNTPLAEGILDFFRRTA